jgi:hypothetical protein
VGLGVGVGVYLGWVVLLVLELGRALASGGTVCTTACRWAVVRGDL